MSKIIEMVKDKVVRFEYFSNGNLWYRTECRFMFPVPISDCGDASFLKEDKATLFMRYVRKQLKSPITEDVNRNVGLSSRPISFEYYRKGEMWYKVDNILFPISIVDNQNLYLRKIEDKIFYLKEINEYKKEIKVS